MKVAEQCEIVSMELDFVTQNISSPFLEWGWHIVYAGVIW